MADALIDAARGAAEQMTFLSQRREAIDNPRGRRAGSAFGLPVTHRIRLVSIEQKMRAANAKRDDRANHDLMFRKRNKTSKTDAVPRAVRLSFI
jgi:hypothetical protein